MAGQRRLRDLVAQVKLDTTPAEQAASRVQGTLFKTSSSTKQLQGGLAAVNAEFSRMGPLGSLVGNSLGNMGNLFPNLSGKLELNAAQWGLLGTKAQAAAYGLSSAEEGMARSAGALPAFGAALGPIALGAAATGAAFEVARSSVDAFVKMAEPVHQLELVSGATAQQASVLSYSFKALSIDSDAGGTAIFRLGKNIDTSATKLQQMGVAIAHNHDGSVDLLGTLSNLADAYARNGDATQRDALLTTAFGRSGAALAPLLAQGSAGLQAFTDQAKAAGLVFNQQQVDQAHQYALETQKLGLEMEGLKVSIGEFAIPALDAMAKHAESLVGVLDDAGNAAQRFQQWQDSLPSIDKAVGLPSDFGDPGDQWKLIKGKFIDVTQAAKQAGTAASDLGSGMDALTGPTAEATKALDEQNKALEALYAGYTGSASAQLSYGKDQQAIAALADDYTKKQLGVSAATDHVKKSQLDLKVANLDIADKQKALNDAIKQYGPNSLEAQRAALDLQSAQLALADATRSVTDAQLAQRDAQRQLSGSLNEQENQVLSTALAYESLHEKLGEAIGTPLDAQGKTLEFLAGLEQVRAELDPANPLRRNLDAYIDQLEHGIPPEINTNITATIGGTRTLTPAAGRTGTQGFAAGGDYSAYQPRFTGEAGMEFDVPQMPGHVYDHAATVGLVREALTGSGSDGGRQLIFSGNIINPQPAATETSIAQGLLRANFLAGD